MYTNRWIDLMDKNSECAKLPLLLQWQQSAWLSIHHTRPVLRFAGVGSIIICRSPKERYPHSMKHSFSSHGSHLVQAPCLTWHTKLLPVFSLPQSLWISMVAILTLFSIICRWPPCVLVQPNPWRPTRTSPTICSCLSLDSASSTTFSCSYTHFLPVLFSGWIIFTTWSFES